MDQSNQYFRATLLARDTVERLQREGYSVDEAKRLVAVLESGLPRPEGSLGSSRRFLRPKLGHFYGPKLVLILLLLLFFLALFFGRMWLLKMLGNWRPFDPTH